MDTGGVVTVEDNIAGGRAQNIALENIRIVMDVDNVTLREVMQKIVQQAAAYTGPWTVKWRLRPENMDLMTERVNLTTEANFGDFCSLLTERVKNMTGTQLFVTAFASSRVLLVADTFY
jgi:putative SOS response-associated peptidase YedK